MVWATWTGAVFWLCKHALLEPTHSDGTSTSVLQAVMHHRWLILMVWWCDWQTLASTLTLQTVTFHASSQLKCAVTVWCRDHLGRKSASAPQATAWRCRPCHSKHVFMAKWRNQCATFFFFFFVITCRVLMLGISRNVWLSVICQKRGERNCGAG